MAPPEKRKQPIAPLPLQRTALDRIRDVRRKGSRPGFFGILAAAAEPTIATKIREADRKRTIGTAPPADLAGRAGNRKQRAADRAVSPAEGRGGLWLPPIFEIRVQQRVLYSSEDVGVVLLCPPDEPGVS